MTPLFLLLLSASPCTIKGRVIDTDHQPVPNATVELRDGLVFDLPDDQPKFIQVTTDAAGRFSACPEFGVTIARADARDYVHEALLYDDEWVRIPRSRNVTLTLRKNPLVTVHGVVVDEDGAPISGAMIERRQNHSTGWRPNPDEFGDKHVWTNPAGEFAISIRADEKSLWVYRRTWVDQTVQRNGDAPVKVVMVKRPTFAVYLVNGLGQPMTGFNEVESRKADGSKIGSCRTRQVEGDCTLEAELGANTVTATINGKTVSQVVRLENTKKVDVTLQF